MQSGKKIETLADLAAQAVKLDSEALEILGLMPDPENVSRARARHAPAVEDISLYQDRILSPSSTEIQQVERLGEGGDKRGSGGEKRRGNLENIAQDAPDEETGPDADGVDWRAIQNMFRADTLSLAAIARAHLPAGTTVDAFRRKIERRAEREGWKKDLRHKVRQRAADELVREAVRIDGERAGRLAAQARNPDEETLISAAARAQVEIVKAHRGDIRKLRELYEALAARAEMFIARRRKKDGVERIRTLDDLRTVAQAVESLGRTATRFIPLEREAFGIDGDEAPASDLRALESRVAAVERGRRGEAAQDDGPAAPRARAREGAPSSGLDGKVVSLEDRIAGRAG